MNNDGIVVNNFCDGGFSFFVVGSFGNKCFVEVFMGRFGLFFCGLKRSYVGVKEGGVEVIIVSEIFLKKEFGNVFVGV